MVRYVTVILSCLVMLAGYFAIRSLATRSVDGDAIIKSFSEKLEDGSRTWVAECIMTKEEGDRVTAIGTARPRKVRALFFAYPTATFEGEVSTDPKASVLVADEKGPHWRIAVGGSFSTEDQKWVAGLFDLPDAKLSLRIFPN